VMGGESQGGLNPDLDQMMEMYQDKEMNEESSNLDEQLSKSVKQGRGNYRY